jgi:tripartite-type tricarboxylate transporter receptor subunit TctC
MRWTWCATIASAICLLFVASSAFAQSAADFYKGKTVTYIVATSPGGGADFFGRLATRHMQRFMPESTFIVKNVPGAGHIVGANTIYASKPDGLTIGSFTTGLTYAQIMGKKGVKFDLTKMSWIGKSDTDIRVLYLSAQSPYRTFDDVLAAKEPIKLGTSGVGSGAYTESQMIAKAFNIRTRVLAGYAGGERTMGMMRGEIDGQMGGLNSTLEVARVDKGHLVLQFGDSLPDVPRAETLVTTDIGREIVKFMQNQALLSRFVAGPPEIPQDRLTVLRTVYKQAFESPELQEEAKRSEDGNIDPLYGDDVAKLVKETIDISPEMVAVLKEAAGAP